MKRHGRHDNVQTRCKILQSFLIPFLQSFQQCQIFCFVVAQLPKFCSTLCAMNHSTCFTTLRRHFLLLFPTSPGIPPMQSVSPLHRLPLLRRLWQRRCFGRPSWWQRGWPRPRPGSVAEAELLAPLAELLMPKTPIKELLLHVFVCLFVFVFGAEDVYLH